VQLEKFSTEKSKNGVIELIVGGCFIVDKAVKNRNLCPINVQIASKMGKVHHF